MIRIELESTEKEEEASKRKEEEEVPRENSAGFLFRIEIQKEFKRARRHRESILEDLYLEIE